MSYHRCKGPGHIARHYGIGWSSFRMYAHQMRAMQDFAKLEARTLAWMQDFSDRSKATMSNFPTCKCNSCERTRARKALKPERRYALLSVGTATGQRAGELVDTAETITGAVKLAQQYVTKWRDTHKGIVIYKATKLVRATAPPVEVVNI